MLFSDASLHTLGFIKAADLDSDRFTTLIREAKPKVIFDLRSIPSFARRTLTRREVFGLFERYGAKYFDVAGVLGVSGARDGLLNPALLVNALQENVLGHAKGLSGPVLFFINEDLFNDDYFASVAEKLPHQTGLGWEIACWPNETTTSGDSLERNLVFISHANPEDNEVAMWFSSRLAANGYQVWSDLTRLTGGEVFWDTIEEVIRKRAAKVIVLLSRRGHQKSGVLDEINIAVATERSQNINRFVIPVRVDDLPFMDVRANLARKNVVDGHSNLAGALSRLLSIFKEDQVPRSRHDIAGSLQGIQRREPSQIDDSEWSILLENKVEVLAWPRTIRKFRSPKIVSSLVQHPTSNGIVTFEDWSTIEEISGGPVARAGEAIFDVGQGANAFDFLFDNRAEVRRSVSSLMRQAWDIMCERRGFLPFELANGNLCWFLKNNFQNANRVRYEDQSGVWRNKDLVGKSPKRGVYWHFAIEARASAPDHSFRVVPHVVFSEDGRTPIASQSRQHTLRRGFCRNWWNARWRDLLGATLLFMSGGRSQIELPVARNSAIEVTARLRKHIIAPHVERIGSEVSQNVIRFEEPKVAVGYGQVNDDPKEGLLLFGPVAFERNPKVIKAGVIGTSEGIDLFLKWSKQFNAFQADPSTSRNSVPFPGFEAVFGARWQDNPVHRIALSRNDLISAILLQDRHHAVFRSSSMYVERITKAVREDDVDVDVWFVVIPDEVFVYGRPASRVPGSVAIGNPGAMGRKAARRFSSSTPSLFAEDNVEAEIYDYQLDFHHQLKARLLEVRAVTQVLRESSLATITSGELPGIGHQEEIFSDDDLLADDEGPDADVELSEILFDRTHLTTEASDVRLPWALNNPPGSIRFGRRMQDRASVAWNLSTATFFKSGGRPWRVANARPGVCYIGLVFKQDPSYASGQACCGAQMFLQDGDGLVFKGAMGPWYSGETGQFHLTRNESARLIRTVIDCYKEEHSEHPRELFIHGRTRFDRDEWNGFCDAIDESATKLTGVRITRSNEFKLFSSGERAVRRGTAMRLSARLGLLWTSGYVERLGTYPGRETPNPLRVEIVNNTKGDSEIETVMEDIMVLTKMNFNACIYGDGMPVTMRFAEAIGDVLITAREKNLPPLPFRYYI